MNVCCLGFSVSAKVVDGIFCAVGISAGPHSHIVISKSTSPVQVMSIGEVIKPPQKYGLLSTNLVPFDR